MEKLKKNLILKKKKITLVKMFPLRMEDQSAFKARGDFITDLMGSWICVSIPHFPRYPGMR